MCHTRRVATLLCHIAAAFEAACQVDSVTWPFNFAIFCPVRTEVMQKCRELSSFTGIDLFQALKVSPFLKNQVKPGFTTTSRSQSIPEP